MITQSVLKELFRYDLKTGHLFWKKPKRGTNGADAPAGALNKKGYRQVRICGKLFYAHRLIWLYMTGEWPVEQIDHLNQDKSDNRFSNLRQANNSQNHSNIKMYRHNTSGVKGVYWDSERHLWYARICVNQKGKYLGAFKSIEEAARARKAAERAYLGRFAL